VLKNGEKKHQYEIKSCLDEIILNDKEKRDEIFESVTNTIAKYLPSTRKPPSDKPVQSFGA
jgi:hypothetical protein